ncbi:MAG: AMP-binding protein [Spirochaetes bacterium]|nr:AMP-binding protein [Spirochaetota bacterium]
MLDYSDYMSKLPDNPHDNFAQLLEQVCRDHSEKDLILFRQGGEKDFTRWTFSKYGEECRRIARGLLAAGLVKGDRVALWAENRPQWMAVWMGAVIAGLRIVPIDFLSSEEECRNIIKITRAKAFFYSGKKKEFAKKLETPFLACVCISPEEDGGGQAAVEYDSFGEKAQNQTLPPPDSIAPDEPASIVFTSGTTGFAKGVTLSHKGIISNVSAAIRLVEPNHTDVFIVVLPLHHTYSTTCAFLPPIFLGIPVVVCEKIIGKVIVDDIRDSGATFLVGVPLLFDKMMAAIGAKYNKLSPLVRLPLNLLRAKALKEAQNGNFEFGQKAFRFLRKKAGLQSVRITVSGGGPLKMETADFFDSLGFNIVNGYGISENSPIVCVNPPRFKRNASVGLMAVYTDVKILSDDGEQAAAAVAGEGGLPADALTGVGEIAIKSPSLMLGYFENEAATKEVFNDEGYLLTGDLGYRDKDGFLYIMGRKKNLIVSSSGKNIYPEEIEACFSGAPIISEILVVGKKSRTESGEQVFAVLVPNMEEVKAPPGAAADESFVRDLVKKEVEAVNRRLPTYKKISGFVLRSEPFEKNAQQKIKRFLYKDYEKPD